MQTVGILEDYKPPASSQLYRVVVKGKINALCNVTFDERHVAPLAARDHMSLERSMLQALDSGEPVRQPVLPFSKLINNFFGYFDPENIFLDNENQYFSG